VPLDVNEGPAEVAGDGQGQESGMTDGAAADAEAGITPVDVPMEMPAPVEVPPERPRMNEPNGAPCAANSECRSNFCIKEPGAPMGICCATACNNGCSACTMAKTGRPDGTCAADRALDRKKCGEACGQLFMDVPAVIERVCENGACVLPVVPKLVETCRKDDGCTSSFCDQPSATTARCVHTVCPAQGSCCCGTAQGARMCVQRNACTGERSCAP
jgi:hypothetical protein